MSEFSITKPEDWSDWVEAATDLVTRTDDCETGVFILRMGRERTDPHVVITNFGEERTKIIADMLQALAPDPS